MLFRQSDLVATPLEEATNILDEQVYLDEQESFLDPHTIPVIENSRLGSNIVQFDDVERLSENNDIDYISAMQYIAETNDIEPNQLAVAVDDWKIIADPDIVNELANVVINPISDNCFEAKLCESILKVYYDTEDEALTESIFDMCLDEGDIWNAGKAKGALLNRASNAEDEADAERDSGKIDDATHKKSYAWIGQEKQRIHDKIDKHLNLNRFGSGLSDMIGRARFMIHKGKQVPAKIIAYLKKKLAAIKAWAKKTQDEKSQNFAKRIIAVIVNLISKAASKVASIPGKIGDAGRWLTHNTKV